MNNAACKGEEGFSEKGYFRRRSILLKRRGEVKVPGEETEKGMGGREELWESLEREVIRCTGETGEPIRVKPEKERLWIQRTRLAN